MIEFTIKEENLINVIGQSDNSLEKKLERLKKNSLAAGSLGTPKRDSSGGIGSKKEVKCRPPLTKEVNK